MDTTRIRQYMPAALYGAPLRWSTPRLAGRSEPRHIALTFDDGPDPRSTPTLLKTLDEHDVRATFFLVGEHIEPNRRLVAEMHAAGHEVAVHGWTHRCVLGIPPARLRNDLARTSELIATITGALPRWYRPPHGVTTLACQDAAEEAGLTTVLWTAWGRDWSRHVDAAGIVGRVNGTLRPGGTILLHDTDRYAAQGSWRRTNAAVDRLLSQWREARIPIGRLKDHWEQ